MIAAIAPLVYSILTQKVVVTDKGRRLCFGKISCNNTEMYKVCDNDRQVSRHFLNLLSINQKEGKLKKVTTYVLLS